MQNIMSCIWYNKSLTITNIQLIITEIRFCICHAGNVWTNMLIRTYVRKPSDKIFYQSITKREVGRGLIPKMYKLWTLLCRVPKSAAKLASNLLWSLVLPCWLLLLAIATTTRNLLNTNGFTDIIFLSVIWGWNYRRTLFHP
jgi:hypothetical protein